MDSFTLGMYIYGSSCLAFGFILGFVGPRMLKIMFTTFTGA